MCIRDSIKSQLVKVSPTEADIIFNATIDNGWHVYSTDLGDDGPISATFNVVQTTGVTPVGKLTAKGKEIKKFDNMFGMELRYFEKEVTFVQRVRFVQPDYSIECYVEYGACDDASCLPPLAGHLPPKRHMAVAQIRPPLASPSGLCGSDRLSGPSP